MEVGGRNETNRENRSPRIGENARQITIYGIFSECKMAERESVELNNVNLSGFYRSPHFSPRDGSAGLQIARFLP